MKSYNVRIIALVVMALALVLLYIQRSGMKTNGLQIPIIGSSGSIQAFFEQPSRIEWTIPNTWSYMLPPDEELNHMTEKQLVALHWKYINTLQLLCREVIRVGRLTDGGKEICVDEFYKPKPPCLVYSFGINNQWDFDEDIVKKFGCEVHCFDPSMKKATGRVSEKIWFYQWGLADKNYINGNKWQLKTLDQIREDLGHTNRTIDVLKMDIEGSEWVSLPQMMSSGATNNVRQMAIELHFVKELFVPNAEKLSTLRRLYEHGYRICMRDRNVINKRIVAGVEGEITPLNEVTLINPTTNLLNKRT